MTDDREFLRATTDWLESGSDGTPPQAIDAVLLAIRTTRQDRALRSPLRPINMTIFARVAVAAAAVVTLALVFNLGLNGGIGSSPTPSPTASPSPRTFAGLDHPTLEPGTRYVTSDPFPIPISFVVPAGWLGNVGGPYGVWLGPVVGNDVVAFNIFDKVYADPCHFDRGSFEKPPTSVDGLANALVNLPGIKADRPTDVSLDGYPAKLVTLQGPDDVTGCNEQTYRLWELPRGAVLDLVPGGSYRLWLLNIQGHRLVVVAVHEPGESAAKTADVQSVIDSIAIEP